MPVRTLGLPDEFQVDGWGRKFAYAVWTPMTGVGSFITYGVALNCGGITVKNAGGVNRSKAAVYALIAYGPDGYGGYTQSGTLYSTTTTNADEETNAIHHYYPMFPFTPFPYTATYVQHDWTQSPTDAKNVFDDQVRFRERWQLQDDYDANVPAGVPCLPGFRIDGAYASNKLGMSVQFADVNGDGKPDLIMVAQDPTAAHYRIYVVFGQSSSYAWPDPLNVSTLDGSNGFYATVDFGAAWHGSVTVMPMDFMGHHDGTMDLVVTACSTNCNGGGTAILFGQKTGWPAGFKLSTLKTDGSTNPKGMQITSTADVFQATLAHTDVNGDGIEDLIVGQYAKDGSDFESGKADVIFGTATPPNSISIDSFLPGITITGIRTYATYTTPSFTVSAGAHTISFRGMTDTASESILIDNVTINGSATQFSDPGFETPAEGAAAAQCPAGSAWTFAICAGGGNTYAGLVGNGTVGGNLPALPGWETGTVIPNAPQGTQAAYIQGVGTISQSVTLAAGTYTSPSAPPPMPAHPKWP